MQVSNDTESVIDTDTAGRGIAGIDYRVLGIAHHYQIVLTCNRMITYIYTAFVNSELSLAKSRVDTT